MKKSDSIEDWQTARALFEHYLDKPITQAVDEINKDSEISKKVKSKLIKLIKSQSQSDTLVENPDLSFFESFNDESIDLSGEIIGQWEVLNKLGEGGMSMVYLVERYDKKLNQKAALKIVADKFSSKSIINRFIRERQILSDLNHNNIAKLFDAGVTKQNTPWLVMELVEGDDILSYIVNNSLDTEQRIILFKQVCETLSYAHAQGVIHRDIKPSNIMINNDGLLKLLDFGIASVEEQKSLTQTGTILGTPGYMSPEQAQGISQGLDRRTDIFSLGVLLYKIINHEMPFEAESISDISYKIIHGEPKLISAKIPIDLKAIIYKCLEKKPENRYQSAVKLSLDIDAYLKGHMVSARRVTYFGRLVKKIKKNPVMSLFFISAILAIILSSAYGVFSNYESLRQVRLAENFLFRSQEIKSKVRRIHMMPIHNVKKEYAKISQEIELLKTEIDKAKIDSSGLSDFAIGNAYLAMRKNDLALEYLTKADKKGWKSAELSSALGLVLALKWDNIITDSSSILDKHERQEFLDAQKLKVYQPAVKYLKQAQAELSSANYISAYLAYIEKDFDSAIQFLEKETTINPWHYEALTLASSVYSYKAIPILNSQGYQQAETYLNLSLDVMGKAIKIGASDPNNYSEYCAYFGFVIQVQLQYRVESFIDIFNQGISVCENALELTSFPTSANIYQNLSYLYTSNADYQESQGNETIDIYRKANKIIEEALIIYPNNSGLLTASVNPLLAIANSHKKKNKSAKELHHAAITNLEKALIINPKVRKTWYIFATLQKNLGNYYRDISDYEQADYYYTQAIAAQIKVKELGNEFSSLANTALVQFEQAKLKLLMGENKQGINLFRQSLLVSEEIFAFNKEVFLVYSNYFEYQYFLIKSLDANNFPYTNELKKAIKSINQACKLEYINKNHIKMIEISIDFYIKDNYAKPKDFSVCQAKIKLLKKS